MREIKFRVWERNLKEVIAVHDINFETKMINTQSAWRHFDEIDLMQYTGLRDKNGVEIYEGDILKVTNPNGDTDTPCVVEWDENCGGYTYEPEYGYGDFDVSIIGWADQMGFTFERIGNIYETPELLGGGQFESLHQRPDDRPSGIQLPRVLCGG